MSKIYPLQYFQSHLYGDSKPLPRHPVSPTDLFLCCLAKLAHWQVMQGDGEVEAARGVDGAGQAICSPGNRDLRS